MIPIPRKHTAEQKDGQDLSGYRQGPASTTTVDWLLKVKDIEYNVGLTKNDCITGNMQKTSSIH